MKNALYIFITFALFTACAQSDGGGSDSGSGQGGSMARFAVKDNILYVVDNSTLKLFDVENAAAPRYLSAKDQKLEFGVETIFTFDTLLLIGSETGLYIYDIRQPEFPQRLSTIGHVRSCDPIVAQGNYAYVTLSTAATRCSRGVNELQVYDISKPSYPTLQKTVTMNSPSGLGVAGNKLFVCDNGLKVYDISNPTNPIWVDDYSSVSEIENIDAYDVIPRDGVLMLIGKDGFYQFDYTGERLILLSKIEVAL
jgi:hypothetical protein